LIIKIFLSVILTVVNLLVFNSYIYISQGWVATQLMCGGIFNNLIISLGILQIFHRTCS